MRTIPSSFQPSKCIFHHHSCSSKFLVGSYLLSAGDVAVILVGFHRPRNERVILDHTTAEGPHTFLSGDVPRCVDGPEPGSGK